MTFTTATSTRIAGLLLNNSSVLKCNIKYVRRKSIEASLHLNKQNATLRNRNILYCRTFTSERKSSSTAFDGLRTDDEEEDFAAIVNQPLRRLKKTTSNYKPIDGFLHNRRGEAPPLSHPSSQLLIHGPVIQELGKLFQISEDHACCMVACKKFLMVGNGSMIRTLHFLKNRNISSQLLQRAPWIMSQSVGTLIQKFEVLIGPHMFKNYSDGLAFCYFSLQEILFYRRRFQEKSHECPCHQNRAYYLAERLQIPVDHVTECMIHVKNLITMKMAELERYIDILQSCNVRGNDILHNMWIFSHDAETLEVRLQSAFKFGAKKPELWMCRQMSLKVLKARVERTLAKEKSSEKENLECLLEKLEMDREAFQVLLMQKPSTRALLSVDVAELKNRINNIYSLGFTADQLRLCPDILRLTKFKVIERCRIFEEENCVPENLNMLMKSPSQLKKCCKYSKIKLLSEYEND